jgi:hypothetical protein
MPADSHTPARIPSVSLDNNVPAPATMPPAQKPVSDPTPADDILDGRPPADPPPYWWQEQIDFAILVPKMTKGHDNFRLMFPLESLFDPDDINHSPSPTTPFAFPFDPTSDQALDGMLADLPYMPMAMDSVTHMVGLPCICGLSDDSSTSVTVRMSGLGGNTTLVDTGANICITGMLEALVDVSVTPPLPISVAVHGSGVLLDDCCTHRGLLPLMTEDGLVYYQMCFYCKNIVETIISPQAIVAASDLFVTWQQTGHKDGSPEHLRFFSDSGLARMSLVLKQRDGLYYAPTDVYTVDRSPVHPIAPHVCRVLHPPTPSLRCPSPCYVPVSKSNQMELELWMLCLGSPGEYQLDMLPGNVTGTPLVFEYHPFWFVNFKEQARVRKQSAHRSAELTTETR